jgi:hypothetical protein
MIAIHGPRTWDDMIQSFQVNVCNRSGTGGNYGVGGMSSRAVRAMKFQNFR